MTAQVLYKIVDHIICRRSPVYDVVYFHGDRKSIQNMLNEIESGYKEQRPTSKIIRTNAEDFRKQTYHDVCNGVAYTPSPACDLYIFEQIEEIAGLEVNEQRLYGLLDCLLESKKQIIITGTEPTVNLSALAPRIRAQIDGGISLSINREAVC